MYYNKNSLPLGKLLQNAGLVSKKQVEKALSIQAKYTKMKLGEILVLQEVMKAPTISFFVNQWRQIEAEGQQFPLGFYLKQAFLLNDEQIELILAEQKNTQLKFGELVVKKGWLNRSTIDFFLKGLSRNAFPVMSLIALEEYDQNYLKLEKKYSNVSLILSRVLAWTGGNITLTKSICQVFANSDLNIPEGMEIKAVDKLIESSIIRNWRTSKLGGYLRNIQENIINNPICPPSSLLSEYQKILLSGNYKFSNTKEQEELLKLGIIIKEGEDVRVSNLIFQQVFNQNWLIETQQNIKSLNTQTKDNTKNKPQASHQVPSTSKFAAKDIKNPDINEKSLVLVKPEEDLTAKGQATEPLTRISALLTLIGIILFIPLVLAINNYYSSLKPEEKLTKEPFSDRDRLEDFCQNINTINPAYPLDLIFQLEKNKETFLDSISNNSQQFPPRCETALNSLRVLAAPQLGKENRVIEAIKHLCKIPEDAENINEAKVWLERWSVSPSWGKETKSYLKLISSCPARDI